MLGSPPILFERSTENNGSVFSKARNCNGQNGGGGSSTGGARSSEHVRVGKQAGRQGGSQPHRSAKLWSAVRVVGRR
jgi:hypothetical protein